MATVSMSVQDALWLTMDRPNNLMVVDGAMVLTSPIDLAAMRQVYEAAVDRFPVFARRAVPDGLGWAWQDDPDFDLDRHLVAVSLPEPADVRQLQQFVAQQRTQPLDRDAPLWVAFLVERVKLADGSIGCAVVNRFHHAIADGVRLTQVMLGLCEVPDSGRPVTVAKGPASPGAVDMVTDAAGTARSAADALLRATGSAARSVISEGTHSLTHPRQTLAGAPGRVAAAPGVAWQGLADVVDAVRHPDHILDVLDAAGVASHRGTHDLSSATKLAATGNAATVWTGKPGTSKAIAWSQPIPLPRVKAIGRAGSATVNDVLITAVAGGLRTYLLERDALIDEVNWMVPVNLKPFADNLPPELGNYFALVFVAMPLSIASPRERLASMHTRMARIKESDEAVMTFGLQRIVSQSPAQIAFTLTNFFANKAVGVLTNVPGPRAEMTFAGVPVQQVIGFAPCSGDQPMTATIFSYNDTVTVGFASDAGLVPDPEVLADLVVAEIDVLADAVGVDVE